MKESVRIFRFAMVGTLNALITALVVWLLMHIEGESYITANIIAYVIAQIHNFIWCKYWIFPLESGDKKNSIWHQMLFFCRSFPAGLQRAVLVSSHACRAAALQ